MLDCTELSQLQLQGRGSIIISKVFELQVSRAFIISLLTRIPKVQQGMMYYEDLVKWSLTDYLTLESKVMEK